MNQIKICGTILVDWSMKIVKEKLMNHKLVVPTILIAGIALLGSIIVLGNKSALHKDTLTFKEEYEKYNGEKVSNGKKYLEVNIALKNKVEIVEETEILNIMDHKTGIVYFGFPTCPWCRNVVEPLIKLANQENVTLYYINPKVMRDAQNKTYLSLVKKLDSYLDTGENGNKVLYVPDIYFIKDGKIMAHHLGTVDSQKDPYQKMNEKQAKEFESIILKNIQKIK